MQSVEAEESLLSMDFFLRSSARTKAGGRAESTVVNEARGVSVKVRGECADTLQRPGEEKKKPSGSCSKTCSNFKHWGEKNALYKNKVNNANNDRIPRYVL